MRVAKAVVERGDMESGKGVMMEGRGRIRKTMNTSGQIRGAVESGASGGYVIPIDRDGGRSALPPDFAAWYSDHRTAVFGYVRFRVATRETAEDVTSEVFMKALRRSLHVSLDRVPDLVAQVPSQEERVLKEERLQVLLNGTRTLREAEQEILSLKYGVGLDNKEIATSLDISPNAVAVRLHRALKRLKDAVEDDRDWRD